MGDSVSRSEKVIDISEGGLIRLSKALSRARHRANIEEFRYPNYDPALILECLERPTSPS